MGFHPLTASDTDGIAYIEALFKNAYSGISGVSGNGYVNVQLMDFDSRIDEMNTRSAETARSCWDRDPETYTIDATAVDPMLSITLNVQCKDLFGNGDASGDGSGLVFGTDGNGNYSAWLTLVQQSSSSDQFGYFGTVKNADSETDREVEYLFLEHWDSSNRLSAMKLRAKPSTGAFEAHYANATDYNIKGVDGGNDDVGLGCGFKIISDGTYVYATGTKIASGSLGSASCAANGASFEICVNASDLSDASVESCASLASSFTESGSLEYTDTDFSNSTKANAVLNALAIEAQVGNLTSDF